MSLGSSSKLPWSWPPDCLSQLWPIHSNLQDYNWGRGRVGGHNNPFSSKGYGKEPNPAVTCTAFWQLHSAIWTEPKPMFKDVEMNSACRCNWSAYSVTSNWPCLCCSLWCSCLYQYLWAFTVFTKHRKAVMISTFWYLMWIFSSIHMASSPLCNFFLNYNFYTLQCLLIHQSSSENRRRKYLPSLAQSPYLYDISHITYGECLWKRVMGSLWNSRFGPPPQLHCVNSFYICFSIR